MAAAIAAVPYASAIKVGLQFKRRFWEEDDQIYGGISYTDLPISMIGYPNTGYHSGGKGVLLGAYIWGRHAMEFTSMTPAGARAEGGRLRLARFIRNTARNSTTASRWHGTARRSRWAAIGMWTSDTRARHYDDLCQFDERIALAGEHASFIGGWQEGAVTSALDAIERLHQRARAQGGKT